jgi:hypothetical protein
MKTHTAAIGIAILLGVSSGVARLAAATSVQVTPAPGSTENAGNILNVAFTASGIPAGETAEIWLQDAHYPYTDTDIVAIDIPVRNGANVASIHIPFSWSPGSYQVRVVITITDANNHLVKQVHSTGSAIIRIRSAVIWPYGGATLNRGWGTWVTWSTQSVNSAQFFRVSVINEATGFRQEVGDSIDPSAGRYFFKVPSITGSGFRIEIVGYVVIPEEDGYLFEDEVEYTQSERLNIK